MEAFKKNENSEENDIVQLLLKRQAELNALLEVTLAINRNSPSSILFEMLEMVLKVNLRIGRMRLLVKNGDVFFCATRFGGAFESPKVLQQVCHMLQTLRSITPLAKHSDEVLSQYDYFIPVRHKRDALAYVLIGDFETHPELINNDLNFIQTLINVIVVALENKKLFKELVIRERLQRDVELASEVQSMLVPLKLPKSDFFEVSARYLPHQNIGGDYFDFIRLNESEFIWCIADVSGKGISAALLMATLQASLRAWVSVGHNLETLVEKLNKIVVSNTNGERFITLFLGVYNKENRIMQYINAGHNPPILLLDNKEYFLRDGTTILGVFEELPFIKTGQIKLNSDSLIFNYTDGLIESPDEEVFISDEELVHHLKLHQHLPVEEINDNMMHDVQSKRRARVNSDDVTLLTIKIL
ncbi:PP2C family protein-serine/threonine phosphatase [Rubrolithibacter danxiaensis]|uniref:PP2C family protein-serine/threonine phosphatase n=1 Tax=Rubrolithibacter danxiaensis TaxID=3390805 RepID=UPI003BF78553